MANYSTEMCVAGRNRREIATKGKPAVAIAVQQTGFWEGNVTPAAGMHSVVESVPAMRRR